jgi:serralysin
MSRPYAFQGSKLGLGALARLFLTNVNDTFDFNSIKETVKGSSRDQILDFSHSQGDKIDLSTIDAKTHASGNQAFHFIGTHAFAHHDGELRFANHILQGDVNGDGKADFEIHVNATSLVAGDFTL